MKNLKKLFSILMALMMLFSVISAVPITAEAATYNKISALKVPRIYQQAKSTFKGGDCNFDCVASVQAYILSLQNKSFTYGGKTRSYSYGKDYKATNSANNAFDDPICKKMYALKGNKGGADPTSILGNLPVAKMSKSACKGNTADTYQKIYKQLKQGKPVVVHANGNTHACVVIGYTKSTSSLSATNFSVMEITNGGNCWKNSTENFNKYANNPQTGKYSSSCYRTLQSWLKDNGNRTINQIYYPTDNMPSPTKGHTLTVNYNVNGGKISSDTYKSVDGMVYKKSGNSKFGQKWTYNNAMKDGLYNAKTFGLSRSGYTFIGWGTTSSGGTVFNQDDTSLLPSKINPDVKTKNCSKTLYAIWKKNPAVTKPSVTVNSPSDLTTNSVKINFTAKNPSKVTIKTIGVQVRKKGTSKWTTKQESMNSKYTKSASVPMWWTVGAKKEVNMVLSAGTTYEYRAYVVYNNTKYYSSIKTFATKKPATKPAVTKPSVTVNSPTDLTKSSVKINFTAKNPSKVTIKTIGVQVRKKGTSKWTTKQESMNSKYTKSASVPMWWTVGSNKELKMKLSAGTTYEYRAYVIYNNTKYYSATKTFTTKK